MILEHISHQLPVLYVVNEKLSNLMDAVSGLYLNHLVMKMKTVANKLPCYGLKKPASHSVYV